MKRIIILLILSFVFIPVFAADFGPIINGGDIDALLANYPAMKGDLENMFSRMDNTQNRTFAEKVDKSSQMLEVFLFYSQSQTIKLDDYIKSFREIVSATKPAEMKDLFNKYNLGDNGFGKYFLATTTTLMLYTQKYYNEEIAKFSPNSEERRYLEGKVASIGEFLKSLHPNDLSQIKAAQLSILKTCM